MAEEEGEKVWEEEGEGVAEPISQVHHFQARTLLSPTSFFGFPLDTHLVQSDNSYFLLMVKVSRGTLGG